MKRSKRMLAFVMAMAVSAGVLCIPVSADTVEQGAYDEYVVRLESGEDKDRGLIIEPDYIEVDNMRVSIALDVEVTEDEEKREVRVNDICGVITGFSEEYAEEKTAEDSISFDTSVDEMYNGVIEHIHTKELTEKFSNATWVISENATSRLSGNELEITRIYVDDEGIGCINAKVLNIEDGIEVIGGSLSEMVKLADDNKVEAEYTGEIFYSPQVGYFNVSDGNKNYSSEDGVLYNKDKTEIIRMPDYCDAYYEVTDEYKVRDSVIKIRNGAFNDLYYYDSLNVNNVCELDKDTFNRCDINKIIIENSDCIIFDDGDTLECFNVISGADGSTAQIYAETYGYAFELMAEDGTLPDSEIYGDVNLDGDVNIADVVRLNLYILNPADNPLTLEERANSDCMRDNVVDSADSSLLMNYCAMMIDRSALGEK